MSQTKYSIENLDKTIQTPMMRQYIDIKKQYKDYLIFFRMGDFYEMFFEDAVNASKILDIALTKRSKEKDLDIPMCGVPHHSYQSYLAKLIKHNQKVVICDQVETPEEAKKRGYKAIVKRDIVRIVTSGTITEDNLLNSNQSNYLLSIFEYKNHFALSYVDISTGDFFYDNFKFEELIDEINKLNPSEIIICDDLFQNKLFTDFLKKHQEKISNFPPNLFQEARSIKGLEGFFNVIYQEKLNISSTEIITIGSLIEYIKITQKDNCPKLNFPKKSLSNDIMQIDNTTIKHLEIFDNYNNKSNKTLYNLLNKTNTSHGARTLRSIILNPLKDIKRIENRQNLISFFIEKPNLFNQLNMLLKEVADIQRIIAKIATNRSNLNDFYLLKTSLIAISHIGKILLTNENYEELEILKLFKILNNDFSQLIEELDKITIDDINNKNISNFIKSNINQELDDLKNIQNNTKAKINELQKHYQLKTKISGLRIKSTNILGYFIEVNNRDTENIDKTEFSQRQSLANATRFTTNELIEFQEKLFSSVAAISEIENQILAQIRDNVLSNFNKLQQLSENTAYLDLILAFTNIASTNGFTRPLLTNDNSLIIEEGFHPVIKENLPQDINEFTANDCNFDNEVKVKLLTGPNMAGKSTYLRQNAIIILLAQIGCFVPAKSAKIGIVDRIFSRIGASDDITFGHSTFMVEMIETATILKQATIKSFIILDEIGRGTSTFDGLSLAMSICEYLHDEIKARVIFATHYHELTQLEKKLSNLKCYQILVDEQDNNILFKHKVEIGMAKKSYGLAVAKLAGIDEKIINKASDILQKLEKNNAPLCVNDLPLFKQPFTKEPINQNNNNLQENPLYIKLEKVNPDELTPIMALELIYELKNEANKKYG